MERRQDGQTLFGEDGFKKDVVSDAAVTFLVALTIALLSHKRPGKGLAPAKMLQLPSQHGHTVDVNSSFSTSLYVVYDYLCLY